MRLDYIECVDCLEGLKSLKDDSIDLVVTSPPYDNLRTYNGFSFDFEGIAEELFRVIKQGGVVVWVVGDAVDNKGSETLTSFQQALHFKSVGFNVHDTMIYQKTGHPFPPSNRYYQVFEYMFVLSKGRPKTANLIKQNTISKHNRSSYRCQNGDIAPMLYELNKPTRPLDNVWLFNTGYMQTTKDKFAFVHSAMFPEELAERHIRTWSNEGDVVLDIFVGSGTTPKMAILNKRHFIGFDISKEYCEIANKRVALAYDIKREYNAEQLSMFDMEKGGAE